MWLQTCPGAGCTVVHMCNNCPQQTVFRSWSELTEHRAQAHPDLVWKPKRSRVFACYLCALYKGRTKAGWVRCTTQYVNLRYFLQLHSIAYTYTIYTNGCSDVLWLGKGVNYVSWIMTWNARMSLFSLNHQRPVGQFSPPHRRYIEELPCSSMTEILYLTLLVFDKTYVSPHLCFQTARTSVEDSW